MKSKLNRYVVLGILGYVLLLAVLLLVEQREPDSAINSFGDAFWYSIVTLSTVGYGDLYPVTAVGRIIGFCFVLMSIGVLSLVVGAVVSRMGRLVPLLQLRLHRDKQWYVFDYADEDAFTLARDLYAHEPNSVFLFPAEQSGLLPVQGTVVRYPGTIAQAVRKKTDRCSLFFIGAGRDLANYKGALAAMPLGFPVYCCTGQVPADCPEGLTLFDRSECCARSYWQRYALEKNEEEILLIGSGEYAQRLLEQALLVNVFCGGRRVVYHAFGDWSEFCRCHPQLGMTVAVNESISGRDSVWFYTRPWNEAEDLLCRAHRIILCDDSDQVNLQILCQIRRYFPVMGKLHLRATDPIPQETVFGTRESICTADLILRNELTAIARMMHQIYADGAQGQAPAWEQLSDFTQQSNIAAADHLLSKIRILLEDDTVTQVNGDTCAAAFDRYCQTKREQREAYRAAEHLRWMRFHSLYNWQYAPVRDNSARRHPLLRPYEELPAAEQKKDDYAWELLETLAQRMK